MDNPPITMYYILLRILKRGIRIIISPKWWPFGRNNIAITLPPFVFYRGRPAPETVEHEQDHLDFAREHLIIGYYVLYLWYTIRYGYWKNPIEVRAYIREKQFIKRVEEEAKRH